MHQEFRGVVNGYDSLFNREGKHMPACISVTGKEVEMITGYIHPGNVIRADKPDKHPFHTVEFELRLVCCNLNAEADRVSAGRGRSLSSHS